MVNITADMVKKLREQSGAGMMECKKALVEANGNMEDAEALITKWGQRKVAKASIRVAAQGRIQIAASSQRAAMAEINCETDFVGKDESFMQFCERVTQSALDNEIQDVDTLLTTVLASSQETVQEARDQLISRIGEKIELRRVVFYQALSKQQLGFYVHQARIGAIVIMEGEGKEGLARDLAMHVAATKPLYIALDDVPAEIVEKEKERLLVEAKTTGKPDEVVEKIVAGQLQKYLNEICLMGQPFVKDPEQTIAALLKTAKAQVVKMARFEVGEGIEVTKKSFEEEVMQVVQGSNL